MNALVARMQPQAESGDFTATAPDSAALHPGYVKRPRHV
jgi:hypothetical protein